MSHAPPSVHKPFLSIIMANIIIHFDNALYGYLVPIMAATFFPQKEQIVQLILGYSTLTIALVARPLGCFLISKMAQNNQEIKALRYTLLGATIGLITIGLLPATNQLSCLIVLLAARTGIEACATGEYSVAHIYIIKNVSGNQAKKFAIWYEVSSMIGILLAGAVGTFFAHISHPRLYYRFPFLVGGLITLLNVVFLRRRELISTFKKEERVAESIEGIAIFQQLWEERKAVVSIATATGFSYMTYAIPFLFMNSFVPMVTTISYIAMIEQIPLFMLFDLCLLGGLGSLFRKYDYNNLMAVSSSLIALFALPLFGGLQGASMAYITLVRSWMVVWGVLFSCFLSLWSNEQVSEKAPYLTIGCATILGKSLLGKPTPAICFYLFYWSNSTLLPACYIALLAFVTTLIICNTPSK